MDTLQNKTSQNQMEEHPPTTNVFNLKYIELLRNNVENVTYRFHSIMGSFLNTNNLEDTYSTKRIPSPHRRTGLLFSCIHAQK